MQNLQEQKDTSAHKVVILGDSRVGKTSILTRQMLGYQPPTQSPTIGCHCSEIHMNVDGKPATLQVWDTAGQEMYRALIPVYLRGAQAAILCYDVTDVESFKSLGHWYDILIDVVPTSTAIYVVGNKIDLSEEAVVDDTQAKLFANVHNAQLFKVSAMTGQGLDSLFEAMAKKLTQAVEPDNIGVNLGADGQKSGCC